MTHFEKIKLLRNNKFRLGGVSREMADEICQRWDKTQRLSQLNQLWIDKLLEELERLANLTKKPPGQYMGKYYRKGTSK